MQTIAPSEYRRRLPAMLELIAPAPFTFKGDVTNGAPAIGNLSSQADLSVGAPISGPGIPAGAHIAQVGPGNTVTMDMNATLTTVQATLTTVVFPAPAPEIHLFKSPASPGGEPTVAYFSTIEANFDTYTFLPLPTPVGPYSQPDGSAEVDFEPLAWILAADPVTPNPQIFGYWIDYLSNGVRTVCCWENFPAPLPMTAAGQAVVISVPIKAPDPGSVSVTG